MYFERAAAHRLIAACAARFPGAALVFDAVPRWLAQRDSPKRAAYQPPRWLWDIDAREERTLGTGAAPSTAGCSRSPPASRPCAAACVSIFAARFGRISNSPRWASLLSSAGPARRRANRSEGIPMHKIKILAFSAALLGAALLPAAAEASPRWT